MTKIFISYRRIDSAQVTGRIYDKLVGIYGHDNVFKDVNSIPLGTDFRKVIEDSLGRCDVLLAVIGRSWLNVTDQFGTRRIDDPNDYVRIEIEFAIERGTRIIPLLVDDASMPLANALPQSLFNFAYRNAKAVRHDPDFYRDLEDVIKSIGSTCNLPNEPSKSSTLRSNVVLIDASLDPNDSPYDQQIVGGTKTIRYRFRTPGTKTT